MKPKSLLFAGLLGLLTACSSTAPKFADLEPARPKPAPAAPATAAAATTPPATARPAVQPAVVSQPSPPARAGANPLAAAITSGIEQTIARANARLDVIGRITPGWATFDNTVGALDDLLAAATRAVDQLALVKQTNSSPEIQSAIGGALQMLDAWATGIESRQDVFRVIQAYADTRPQLSPAQSRQLAEVLRDYRRPDASTPQVASLAQAATPASAAQTGSVVAPASKVVEAIATPVYDAPTPGASAPAVAASSVGASETPPPFTLAIERPAPAANGSVNVRLDNSSPGVYCIWASADLANWQLLGFATNTAGTARFSDTPPPSQIARFYRALLLATPPRLALPTRDRSGQVRLEVLGAKGQVYEVQASSDLRTWETLGATTNLNGTAPFADPASTNLNRRFYRAVLP